MSDENDALSLDDAYRWRGAGVLIGEVQRADERGGEKWDAVVLVASTEPWTRPDETMTFRLVLTPDEFREFYATATLVSHELDPPER